jgi:hypothetical protein
MIWLDAHLSPRVARWIKEVLGLHLAQAMAYIEAGECLVEIQ